MAAEVAIEDDDAWLYGDNEEQRKEELNAIFDRATTDDLVIPGEEVPVTNGEITKPEEASNEEVKEQTDENEVKSQDNDEEKETDEDEDSDDDDDDVQITIGDIKPASTAYPYGGAPVNLNIKRGGAFTSGAGVPSMTKTKGLDIETVGVLNGVSIYEFNLDTIEDKPWRKPGADITDYFNYGFTEDSWRAYCEKQRKLRLDNNVNLTPKASQLVPGKDQQIPIATVNENSKYSGLGMMAKKAGPPPGRRMSGSIDVICGANSSRRGAKENVIQVIGRGDGFDPNLPPGMPPTHIPPPFIPPNLSVPPPGLPPGIPPPNFPPPGTLAGHVPYPDLYGNPILTQPPPLVPGVNMDSNQQYDEQFFTGSSSRHFDGNSESQNSWANSPRERDRDRDRDRERNRDRSRDKEREHYWDERNRERSSGRGGPPNEEDYKRREREDYERRRYRDYRERRDKDRYDRDYEREYHERDRERDRDRDSREKDRERRHRDKERDERHKERSSRRRHHHEEEEEHHSSRHKHKKSKREKEESVGATEATETTPQPEVIVLEDK